MRFLRRLMIVSIPVLALAACATGLSEQDRAAIDAANQNAEQAKQQSALAVQEAQAAQASAAKAASDANAANEKADRMFQRTLRK